MKIVPLTPKMKLKVKKYGDTWKLWDYCNSPKKVLISPISYHGKDPLMIWVTPGRDIEIKKEMV